MSSLILDSQPEAVRRFFESLVLTSEGMVAELHGKPLARIVPASTRSSEWSDAKTARRYHLIDRDVAGTITPNELLELDLLQEELECHVERVAPLPLDELKALHQQLTIQAANAEQP